LARESRRSLLRNALRPACRRRTYLVMKGTNRRGKDSSKDNSASGAKGLRTQTIERRFVQAQAKLFVFVARVLAPRLRLQVLEPGRSGLRANAPALLRGDAKNQDWRRAM
jgi:hypothetical protein